MAETSWLAFIALILILRWPVPRQPKLITAMDTFVGMLLPTGLLIFWALAIAI